MLYPHVYLISYSGPSCSRPMISHHVTCHGTVMSYTFLSSLKEKKKGIQKKRNIKSRKINKRKRKMLVSKLFHNSYNSVVAITDI